MKFIPPSSQVKLSPTTTTSTNVNNFISGINTDNSQQLLNLRDYICLLLRNNRSSPAATCSSSSNSNTYTNTSTTTTTANTLLVYIDHLDSNNDVLFLLASLLVVILVAAVSGNILVLVALAYNKATWTNMDLSMLSLAVSDVMVSTTCIPLFVDQVMNSEWTFSSLSCRAIPFFLQLSVSANMLTLCCLAVDRYLAIVYPLKFTTFKKMRTTQVLIVCAWIISLLSAAPRAFHYDVMVVCGRWQDDRTCHQDFTYSMCMATHTKDLVISMKNMRWISFAILFICPTLVMGVAYGIIIHTLWIKATVGMVVLSAAAQRNRYKRKAVKMLVWVVSSFIICWAPLQIWALVAREQSLEYTTTTKMVDLGLKCLAMSSTAFNPIIYAFMNQKFRSNFRNILLRRRCVRVAPQHIVNKDNHNCVQNAKDGGNGHPVSNNTTALRFVTQKTTSTKVTAGTNGRIYNNNNNNNNNNGQSDVKKDNL